MLSWEFYIISHLKKHIIHDDTKVATVKSLIQDATLVDNKIVHHSDVVGASPTGAAPTTSSFST